MTLSVLEYQTAVMRRDFDAADKILPTIPKSVDIFNRLIEPIYKSCSNSRDQRSRVAHFLEKQGFKKQALAVSTDPDHRFDLALALGELQTAHEIAKTADSEEKWRQLSTAAASKSELPLAG